MQATPTNAGTLQLQINQGAVLKDLAGINLITGTALADDTVITVEAITYGDWATGGEPFDGDSNGDGVDNGLAFLLGAANPSENAIDKLPVVTKDGSGNLVPTFSACPMPAAAAWSCMSSTAATSVSPTHGRPQRPQPTAPAICGQRRDPQRHPRQPAQ